MNAQELARDLLRVALQLEGRADLLTLESGLMGCFPEFNSLTVVGLVAGIEEQLGCAISDSEINEEVFQTFGSLTRFIEKKMS